LLAAVNTFDRVAQQTSLGWQPGLQLELALTRLAAQVETEEQPAHATPQKQAKMPAARPAQAVKNEPHAAHKPDEAVTVEKIMPESRETRITRLKRLPRKNRESRKSRKNLRCPKNNTRIRWRKTNPLFPQPRAT
jgi:hypothetical protein